MVLQEDTLKLLKEIQNGLDGEFVGIKEDRVFDFLNLVATNYLSNIPNFNFDVRTSDILGLRDYCKNKKETTPEYELESYYGMEAFLKVFDTLYELKEYRNCMRFAGKYIWLISAETEGFAPTGTFLILNNESTEKERKEEADRFKLWLINEIKSQIRKAYSNTLKKNILLKAADFNTLMYGIDSNVVESNFRAEIFSSKVSISLDTDGIENAVPVLNTYNQKAASFLSGPPLSLRNDCEIRFENIEPFLNASKKLGNERFDDLVENSGVLDVECKYFFISGIAEIIIPILLKNVSDEFKKNLYIIEDRCFLSNGKVLSSLDDDCKKKAFGELNFVNSKDLL